MQWVHRISKANPVGARGAEHRAAGRRLGRRAAAAAGRHAAGDRRQAGHAVSRGRARGRQQEQVAVTVWRANGEKTLQVQTATAVRARSRSGGANGPAPRCRRRIAPSARNAASRREGVYVAYFEFGSPASRYGLVPGRRIVEVDGQPTPDLDCLSAAGQRPRRPLLAAHQDARLERCARGDHSQARPALLAGL